MPGGEIEVALTASYLPRLPVPAAPPRNRKRVEGVDKRHPSDLRGCQSRTDAGTFDVRILTVTFPWGLQAVVRAKQVTKRA